MKKQIPMPVFIGIIVVVVGIAFYIMHVKAQPARRPEGAPSNLESAVAVIRKESGQPITGEKYRHRKD